MVQLLASIRDLSVRYRTRDDMSYAVDQVSLDIQRGSVYALVGESGSGKTTVGMSLMNLLPDEADILGGEVWFGDKNVLTLNDNELREIRGRRATMIFQDPVAGLNPVIEIGDQVAEVLTTHLDMDKRAGKIAALEILTQVGLPDPQRVAKSYPFQLSGGMCQRVMIGIATALRPELIIADEPPPPSTSPFRPRYSTSSTPSAASRAPPFSSSRTTSASSPRSPTRSASCTPATSSRRAPSGTSSPRPCTPTRTASSPPSPASTPPAGSSTPFPATLPT